MTTYSDRATEKLMEGDSGGHLKKKKKNYGKTTSQIFMKLGGRVEHGPRKNPLKFSVDRNDRTILKLFIIITL